MVMLVIAGVHTAPLGLVGPGHGRLWLSAGIRGIREAGQHLSGGKEL